MASPSSPQHEPTMEEILASIRKIISEDSNEPQPAVAPAAAQPVQAEADVLELTQEIEEPAPVAPQPAPQPVQAVAPAPAPEPVRPAPQPVHDEVVFQTVQEPPAAAPTPVAAQHSPDSLVSDKARGAIDDALSALDFGTPEPHNSKAPVAPVGDLSVEAVFDRAIRETFEPVLRAWLQENAAQIVDRMKPAIREWMDQNLPDMMKAAVEAEVQRAVRARSQKR
jgi:uncharacterized protein